MNSKIIPYGKQHITQEDIDAVVNVLKSDFLTQGPEILKFEEKFAKYIGARYAVAVANGTAALHLAALALDIKPGDKVITTPITFAASANCIAYCGGEIIFADIDPDTYLIEYNHVAKLLETHSDIVGMVLVDFAGRAIDIEKFRTLADQHNIWIIEDACHAPGAYFIDEKGKNQNCGNGVFSDCTVFSFHPVKHIASGEGGMITTNSEDIYNKLLKLRTHGITKENNLFTNDINLAGGKDAYPLWYMEMQVLGYNYRITDFQAALGTSQLSRADENIQLRRAIAHKYNDFFKPKKYIKRQSGEIDGHAYHLYVLEVDDRLGLYNYLRTKNIFAQIHYFPCHLMPYYQEKGWKVGDLPHSEEYYRNCISIPMYPTLTEEEQHYIMETIDNYYK